MVKDRRRRRENLAGQWDVKEHEGAGQSAASIVLGQCLAGAFVWVALGHLPTYSKAPSDI